MRRDGCLDAQRVGGGGDLGGGREGNRPTRPPLGNSASTAATAPAVRRSVHRICILYGTARQVDRADVAVIVINGRVSAPAVAFANQQRLHAL
ncbi:hypothetical protein SALBM311S_12655 [Streptomyces alboniger]